ncbi:MAG: signal recognition particle-docking protein FtsY, partial [Paracoccus sp. (in: a-proteobacteria)]
MAFFSKLRERLTRSSSKIGAGLDDIVGDDAAAPPAGTQPVSPPPSSAPAAAGDLPAPMATPHPQP